MKAPEEPSDIHVLVIDDSAVVRQAMSMILNNESGFSVSVAPDPIIAFKLMAARRPDVILLDLLMPKMDGMTFLLKLVAEDPIPVIICSEAVSKEAELAFRALDAGAVDLVTKPRLGVQEFLHESAVLLTDAIRAAAQAKLHRKSQPYSGAKSGQGLRKPMAKGPAPAGAAWKVVALGASTGGTDAIRVVLRELPEDCPGLLIVQHMPAQFTATFAEKLDRVCQIQVREAKDGDLVRPGQALVAPGNRHLLLAGASGRYHVRVDRGPLTSRHRPSVDVLFDSVARVARKDAVGILLTGMGDDGARGLLSMRRAGAHTFAQDEATSVVFGMPKEAIANGAADTVLPLEKMAAALLSAARARGR
jgi:two-component system chemotaxis response regulator CheB